MLGWKWPRESIGPTSNRDLSFVDKSLTSQSLFSPDTRENALAGGLALFDARQGKSPLILSLFLEQKRRNRRHDFPFQQFTNE